PVRGGAESAAQSAARRQPGGDDRALPRQPAALARQAGATVGHASGECGLEVRGPECFWLEPGRKPERARHYRLAARPWRGRSDARRGPAGGGVASGLLLLRGLQQHQTLPDIGGRERQGHHGVHDRMPLISPLLEARLRRYWQVTLAVTLALLVHVGPPMWFPMGAGRSSPAIPLPT